MTAWRAIGIFCGIVCLSCIPGMAQETRIRVVQSGADNLMSDLKDIVDLTPDQALRKEWKNLGETLDGFLMGIDRVKPMRIDFTIGKDAAGKSALTFEPSFPISKFKGKKGDSFVENLDSFGYKVKETKETDLYEITQPGVKGAKPMYLRHIHGYAIISENQKSIPATLPDPIKGVNHLIQGGQDVAAELRNDAAGAPKRQAEFQSLRKELEAAIKFKRNEDKSEFELRKLGASQFFDEIERFVMESELLTIHWTTAPGAKLGTGNVELSALPDTSLLKSIQILSTKPNYFAGVKLHAKESLSGKWLFPLDELRQAQAKDRHPVLRAATKAGIDKRPNLTEAGKAAAKEAFDLLVDIFDASIDIGFEGFIDMHDDGGGKGQQTAVVAGRIGKAANVDAIVAMLPKIRDDWNVKLKAHKHQDVTIHEVSIPKRRQKEFEAVFGGPLVLYIGTSEKAVWGACGVDSLTELKAAIDGQATPGPEAPDPDFLTISAKFGPWVRLLDVMEANAPPPAVPLTRQEQQQQKEREQMRKLALKAFSTGDELLTGKLTRDGDKVKGEMAVNEGILRFIGSTIADFSKKNLR